MLNKKNLILKIDSKIKTLESLKFKTKYWNISYALGEILFKIVEDFSPKNVLEIGTSNGFSTLWIYKGINLDSKITTIEVNDSRSLDAKNNFNEIGIDNITQINGEIFNLIETKVISEKFDFIFLDAAQKFYLDLIKKLEKFNLLSKNFILVADNVLTHDNMGPFLIYMKQKYDCEILNKDSGFLIAKSFT